MDAALVAYRTLVELAQLDGRISDEERRLLERYREALGLERETAGLAELEPHPATRVSEAFTTEQSSPVLQMMIRVAVADNVLTDRERRRLEQVADRLGVGQVKYAEILVGIQQEVQRARRTRSSQKKLLGTLAVALVVVAVVIVYLMMRGASTEEMEGLQARLDQMAIERAALDEELVRRSLEGSVDISAFKGIEARYGPSVLLVVVAYELNKDGVVFTHWSSGSGFFISPDGLIVTNKHVVQPWKYSPEIAQAVEAGFQLDAESLRMAVWPGGANLVTEAGELDFESGYYNENATLRLYNVSEDVMHERTEKLSDGSSYRGRLHVLGLGDLAVLKAEVTEPVRSFSLPRALPGIEKLDPVMLLGFPRGIAILEAQRAELSVALGEVSKIENSVMISAPVVPGNSGGPVVNRDGEVIGVATLTPGQGLGICIQTADLLPLLPTAGELIKRGSASVARGQLVEAHAFLDLAELREPTPSETTELVALRERAGDRRSP